MKGKFMHFEIRQGNHLDVNYGVQEFIIKLILNMEKDLEHIITAVQHQFESALRENIRHARDNIPVGQIIQKLNAKDIEIIMNGLAELNKTIQCTLHNILTFFDELCSLLQRSQDVQVVLSTCATIFHHLFENNEDEIDFREEEQRFLIICKDLSFYDSDVIANFSLQIMKYYVINHLNMHDFAIILQLLQDQQYLWKQGMTLQKTHNTKLRLLKGEVILSIASLVQCSRVFQTFLQVFWRDLEEEKCDSNQVISSLILGFQREDMCQIINSEQITKKLLLFGPDDPHEHQKHFKIISLLTKKPQAVNFLMTTSFMDYFEKNIKTIESCRHNRANVLSILTNCAINLQHTKTIIAHTKLIIAIHKDFLQQKSDVEQERAVCHLWKQILARNSSFQVYRTCKEMEKIITRLFSIVNFYLSQQAYHQKQIGFQILLPILSYQSRWRLQEPLLDTQLEQIQSEVTALLNSQQDQLTTLAIQAQQIFDNLPLSYQQMSKRSKEDFSFTQSRENIQQRANTMLLGSLLDKRQKYWLIKCLQNEFSAKIKKTISLYRFSSDHKTNAHEKIDGHYPIVLIGILKSGETFACVSQKPFLPCKVIRGRFAIISFNNRLGTKFLLQDASYVEKYQSILVFGGSFASISTTSNKITFSRQILSRIFDMDESMAGYTKIQQYEIFKPILQ